MAVSTKFYQFSRGNVGAIVAISRTNSTANPNFFVLWDTFIYDHTLSSVLLSSYAYFA